MENLQDSFEAFKYRLKSGKEGIISLYKERKADGSRNFKVDGIQVNGISILNISGNQGRISLSKYATEKIFGIKKDVYLKIVSFSDGTEIINESNLQINTIIGRVTDLEGLKEMCKNIKIKIDNSKEVSKLQEEIKVISDFHRICEGED